MTTTGHMIFAHIRAMITVWEEVEEEDKVEDWGKAVVKHHPFGKKSLRCFDFVVHGIIRR